MNYLENIRERCIKKIEIAKQNHDLVNLEKNEKLKVFLNNNNCFSKIKQLLAYEILFYLDFSQDEIKKMYPQLISFRNVFGKYILDEN